MEPQQIKELILKELPATRWNESGSSINPLILFRSES
jgi:hypothetical protein